MVQLAFGLSLTVEETQALLKAAQKRQLYPKLKRDAALLYGLSHGLTVTEVQSLLEQLGLTLQGGGYAVAKCYREGAVCSREDEGEILERLDHPGLPRFLGRYENGAMRCIVREYAQVVPLSELPIPLSAKEMLDVTVQLCDLLTYLHSRMPPVIHRDIKPQNLVLGPDGRVMLIDFGISRSYDETAEADTVCLGTSAFSPPEQYGFAQTDPRACCCAGC